MVTLLLYASGLFVFFFFELSLFDDKYASSFSLDGVSKLYDYDS